MNQRFSLYLDALRVTAALTVLLSHFAYERFTGGRYLVIRELNLGSDAVVLFFVLSGLVIAFTATTKDKTAGRYLFNRATRILSVAIPALALTFVLDRLGAAMNPAAYHGLWYAERSPLEMAFYGLSFSGEWQIPGVRLGSNGPYWSLSYEVAYYLLFAAAIYLSGAVRIVVLALLAFLAGIKVLLLLPIWLAGAGLWRLIETARLPNRTAIAAAMVLAPPIAYALLLAAGAPGALFALTSNMTGIDRQLLRVGLGFSDEFAWNILLGLLAAIHIAGVAALLALRAEAAPARLATAIRWLAGASFSIYLVHYPAMQFLDAMLPDAMSAPARDVLLLALTLCICFCFAEAFERPLRRLRRGISSLESSFRAYAGLQRPEPNV